MATAKKETIKKAAAPVQGKAANPVRPVDGKINYKAMREDLMATFPKTLARLAE